jgi:hypothetical protein
MSAARQIILDELDRTAAKVEEINYREMESDCQLKEWGKWGRLNHDGLGYPKLPAFSGKGWGVPDLSEVIPDITDFEGMRIDAAVSKLPKTHNQVIQAIYLYRVPWLKLPEVLHMTKIRIEAYQHQAIGILWQHLKRA